MNSTDSSRNTNVSQNAHACTRLVGENSSWERQPR
jgi:hypothetical protein